MDDRRTRRIPVRQRNTTKITEIALLLPVGMTEDVQNLLPFSGDCLATLARLSPSPTRCGVCGKRLWLPAGKEKPTTATAAGYVRNSLRALLSAVCAIAHKTDTAMDGRPLAEHVQRSATG